MSYKVKINNFEGPFDLLCYLIESAEMNIYDIQVSQITNQYLAYIERLRLCDPALGGEFMVLAASLIELKSKMLLPRAGPAGADGEDDPRSELVMKLLAYRKFKAAAAFLREREDLAGFLFEKPAEDLQAYTNEPDEYLHMDPVRFAQAFRLFLGKKQRMDEMRSLYERAERQRETTEMRMAFIKGLFSRKNTGKLGFRELLKAKGDRFEMVLTFMALLEMIRNRSVKARQNGGFAEITVELYEKEAASHAEQRTDKISV
ncbi:MAG: segregation/condensation protein A [Clostridiales Family XIII bacterium]|jgi:segregation and condensation protein A|nr:segregation/condensation protein A [Clostridiales Family XIII bacterium]